MYNNKKLTNGICTLNEQLYTMINSLLGMCARIWKDTCDVVSCQFPASFCAVYGRLSHGFVMSVIIDRSTRPENESLGLHTKLMTVTLDDLMLPLSFSKLSTMST